MKSAVELLNDVESTLAILKLGTTEEQQYYVSTWSSILSVCAHELKHGASIWKQSSQKNVQNQILSEPEGIGCLLGTIINDGIFILCFLILIKKGTLSCPYFYH